MSWENEEHQRRRNWDNFRNDTSRDSRSQRSTFGPGRTFSCAADRDQNWRERGDNASSAPQAKRLEPSYNPRMFVPFYNRIREIDESILEGFRSSIKYVGDYSEDAELNFSLEKHGFHYLNNEFRPDDDTKVKEVNFDLNVASDKMEKYTASATKLFENFLIWITRQPDVLSGLKIDPNIKSISGSIYIEDIPIDKFLERLLVDFEVVEEKQPTKKPRVSREWSHKFEQYMCGEDTTKGAIPNEQFRLVITSKLGPYDLLYNSPMDAVNPEIYTGERDFSSLVKLSTTCVEYSHNPARYINSWKPYEWVLQMLLAGTNEMIAGFCDTDGIVSQLRLYSIEAVEDLLTKGKDHWNLHKNFTFAVKLLDFVKKQTESSPGTTFFFEKLPGSNFITCEKVDDKFVPDWFIEKLGTTIG